MPHRGGGDPGALAAKSAAALAFRRRDAGEAAGDLRVDREKVVGRLDPGERREARGPHIAVGRPQYAELQLGGGDDRDGNFRGQFGQVTAGLLGDEDGGVGDGAAQSSSISPPRTSARSSSRPASEPVLRLR